MVTGVFVIIDTKRLQILVMIMPPVSLTSELLRCPHPHEIRSNTPRLVLNMWYDISPNIGRSRIAMKKD